MAAAAIVELKIEVFELQRHCVAQLVLPGDAGVADNDSVLRQQPVGEIILVARLRCDFQSGGKIASVPVAAHQQCRLIQLQSCEAQLEMPQRAPGQLCLDFVETQCATALSVADLEAF